MARGKKSIKQKHYPVVLGSELGSTTETQNVRILQVDRALSELNRRLYRMGRYYKVKVDLDAQPLEDVEIYTLRDDWAVQKAYQMAYKMYLENTAEERERLGAKQVARWEDFRVEVGVSGEQLVPVLHTVTLSDSLLTTGSFERAAVTDAANTARNFTWGTPTSVQYGLLQEYDKYGDAQASPQSDTANGPYEDINTEVNAQTMDDLQDRNDTPPYDQTGVNATSPFVRIATLGSGANGSQRLSTGFFTAPCGIVICVGSASGWNSNDLSFEVAKGDYKGVHAPSMLE
jgi:hypothetical protein